jgi:hypothetical protein
MSEEKLTLEEGSYYLVDFEVRIKENNQLIDTNIEDVAKKEKFSKEGLSFTPILLILDLIDLTKMSKKNY